MILGDSLHTFAQSWIELTPHQINQTTSKSIHMLAHPSLISGLYRLNVSKKLVLNARCFQNFNFWVGASPATGEQISSETIIVMETARAYFLHVKKLCSSFTLEKFPNEKFWNNEELFACLHGILIESKQKELLAVISYLPLLFATRGIQDSVKKTVKDILEDLNMFMFLEPWDHPF